MPLTSPHIYMTTWPQKMTNECLYPLSYPVLPRATPRYPLLPHATPYYVRLLMHTPEPLVCPALSPYKTLGAC